LKSAEVLLSVAESTIGEAIKQGDMDTVSVAHGLLEVARTRTSNATKELRVIAEKWKKCAEKLKVHSNTDCQVATAKKLKH